MPIEVNSLADLDDELVAEILDEQTARVQEENPELILTAGALHDHLLYNDAILEANRRVNTDRYRRSTTITGIAEDPTLADDELVDAVLSNARMTRKPGLPAQGSITLVVSTNTTVVIGSGSLFTANGKQFAADQSYVAKKESEQINSDSDRQLNQISGGQYAFSIDVTAVEEGQSSRLTKGTAVIPATPPTNFVRAYATDDFINGRDLETNASLVQRYQEGMAAKALSGPIDMQAALREVPEFEDVVTSAVIGFGDEEMLRDAHTIFPVSFGGRVDWYIRTDVNLLRQNFVKSCLLVEKTTDGFGIWQFSLLRDEAPGFYEVSSIQPSGASVDGSFELTEETRTIDDTDAEQLDVQNLIEGAYSRYQAATFRFKDTLTATANLTVGDTADYDVAVAMLPLIAEIQETFGGRDRCNSAGDLLVRAPIPCFVGLSFAITKGADEEAPDLENIRTALAEVVNRLDFVGRLSGSTLQSTIHGFLSGSMTVSAIDMLGRLRLPTGESRYLRDLETITIPHLPQYCTTARTVQFFLDPTDIGITVVNG